MYQSKVSLSSIHPNSLSFVYHAPACMNHLFAYPFGVSRSLLQDYHDCERKGHELVKYQETSWVDLRVCLKGSNMNGCFGFLGGWKVLMFGFGHLWGSVRPLRICNFYCHVGGFFLFLLTRLHITNRLDSGESTVSSPPCYGAAIGFLAWCECIHENRTHPCSNATTPW